MANEKTYIIGAGIAGLTAAIELEKKGRTPTIFEASESVGGRVKTDSEGEFLFDRGFQVLLTQYPEAKQYLDFDALNLRKFNPGAQIFDNDRVYKITDPLRQPAEIFSTLISPAGTIKDKYLIWRLSEKLKKDTIKSIFDKKEITTKAYLQNFGFSNKIINRFFRPFFAGIFLEDELLTSSRMFEFVFKMFSEGHAAIPAKGMQEIPKQLASRLKKTTFRFNSTIKAIENKKLIFDDGSSEIADQIIIATDPTRVISGLAHEKQDFHEVTNIYFEVKKSIIENPTIGLIAKKGNLINNFHYPSDISDQYSLKSQGLLSVSVVKKHKLEEAELLKKVIEELAKLGISNVNHLKTYHIKKALPVLKDFQYMVDPTSLKLYDDVFVAGDQMLNPSLNAAMTSGRLAAFGVLKSQF